MNHKGLNQLLCAAVVNTRFRELLLQNPGQAIAAGYLDHKFTLTPEERDVVVGIRARHLEDFAAQVHTWMVGAGSRPAEKSRPVYGTRERAAPTCIPFEMEVPAEWACVPVAVQGAPVTLPRSAW